MSVYAQAAVDPKETITVTAAPAPQKRMGPARQQIAVRQSATATKTDTPIQKFLSLFQWSPPKMALHQPKSVKGALQIHPGRCRGYAWRVNTYDFVIIAVSADGQSQNNYLNGLKMQGNF